MCIGAIFEDRGRVVHENDNQSSLSTERVKPFYCEPSFDPSRNHAHTHTCTLVLFLTRLSTVFLLLILAHLAAR